MSIWVDEETALHKCTDPRHPSSDCCIVSVEKERGEEHTCQYEAPAEHQSPGPNHKEDRGTSDKSLPAHLDCASVKAHEEEE